MRILSEYIIDNKKIITIEIDKNQEIEVKRKKRSKNANSYFWELLQQLCEEMNLNVIEEYKSRVKELGIFRQWEIDTKNTPTFVKMWEDKGIAWFVEIVDIAIDNKIVVNAYYGSSSYNSQQMSKLIDGLVQDCQAVGIETKTIEEINSLLKGVE